MSDFDPYHQWLGIPETARPISKYRLLAIEDFEADRGVISAAAEQRTIYLRTLQAGEHEVLVAQLLNEVSQARVCLLDGKSKSRYDTQLRSDLEPEPEQDPLAFAAEALAAVVSKPATRSRPRSGGGKPFWQQPRAIPAAAGGVVVLLLLMWLFGSDGTNPPINKSTSTTQGNQKKTQPTTNNETLPAKVAAAPPLAVAPFDAAQATAHQQAWSKHLRVPIEFSNSINMTFRLVPPGVFLMGSPENEEGREANEPLDKWVVVPWPIYMCIHETTRAHIARLRSQLSEDQLPLVNIDFEGARHFCRQLSASSNESQQGRQYRLATESEWEYCCRAGSVTAFCFGDNPKALNNYAWFGDNSDSRLHPVGIKQPNAWGLFDLHGNAIEWTTTPLGTLDHIVRGGSFDHPPKYLRSSKRGNKYRGDSYTGFRVICEIPSKIRRAARERERRQIVASVNSTGVLPPSLQQGLVAYYPFNGNAQDESGNGHDGVAYGTVLCPDRFGHENSSYRFNGVDNYIRVEDTELLRLSKGAFTINLWARVASEKGMAALVFKRRLGSQTGYSLGIHYERQVSDYIGRLLFNVSGGGDPAALSEDVLSSGSWVNVAVVHSKQSGTLSLYFDGKLDSTTGDFAAPNSEATPPLFFGHDTAGNPYWFCGDMDDIRIYNRALSEAEVKALYDFEKP